MWYGGDLQPFEVAAWPCSQEKACLALVGHSCQTSLMNRLDLGEPLPGKRKERSAAMPVDS